MIRIIPRNLEKNKTKNVTKIEIARNLYPSLCILGKIVLNIILSLLNFLNMYKNHSLSINILWQKLKLKIRLLS